MHFCCLFLLSCGRTLKDLLKKKRLTLEGLSSILNEGEENKKKSEESEKKKVDVLCIFN